MTKSQHSKKTSHGPNLDHCRAEQRGGAVVLTMGQAQSVERGSKRLEGGAGPWGGVVHALVNGSEASGLLLLRY